MRKALLDLLFCVVVALCGCRYTSPLASGDPRGDGSEADRTRSRQRLAETSRPRKGEATEDRRASRAAGVVDGFPRGDDPSGESGRSGEAGRSGEDGRAIPRRDSGRERYANDLKVLKDEELLVSLVRRIRPDRRGDLERIASDPWTMSPRGVEIKELLERMEAHQRAWFQLIRIGPWKIWVLRDTFYDPYRRDSGWIDIDELR